MSVVAPRPSNDRRGSPHVDGDYHTARNHPLLRASGISTLDSAKYYSKGPEVLRTILAEAPELSLRWVVVLDDWYFKELFAAGFELKDVFDNGVSIFEREASCPSTFVRPGLR